jgi:hypothetical protein
MDEPRAPKTSKAFWIFWTLFFLSLFFNLWLWRFFRLSRPIAPDPSHRRIYCIDDHGRVVYLNLVEYCAAYAHWVLNLLVIAAMIIWKTIGAFASLYAKKPEKKADAQPPR